VFFFNFNLAVNKSCGYVNAVAALVSACPAVDLKEDPELKNKRICS
jgi:hypothetical protein